MPDQKSFEFIHEKSDEQSKLSLFNCYYRNKYLWNHRPSIRQLYALADIPVNTDNQFGNKMVIALAFDNSSTFFRRCAENGQLKQYFPELFNCIGCKQDPLYHIDDVFNHIMLALDALAELNTTTNLSITEILFTKLAILFHDIGKPVTRVEHIAY
jgi:UTP:GlnB (protein PII) uridylyltransferase